MSVVVPGAEQLAGGVSLDALFRANVVSRSASVALVDPSDRASFAGGAPLRLTYADADAAVERLTRKLRSFGLPKGSVVALQLPNIAESVLSLLAVLRANLIAAPVPMLWRRSDLVSALAPVEPKALITLARFHDERPAEVLCEAAADLFSLSFPCAFGTGIPDGVIALDEEEAPSTPEAPIARGSAGSISIVSFDAAADGFFAVARNDAQWLAAGLATLLEGGIGSGDTIVSAVPCNSLAGIGGAFVPWLLSGGTLELVQGAPPEKSVAGSASRAHLLGPATALAELAQGRMFASCIAVHRGGRVSNRDLSALPCERIVDLFAFGEIGAVALRRERRDKPEAIPLGPISAPAGAPGAAVVVEARMDDGRILLRGPMVPNNPYPSELVRPRLRVAGDGFVSTGYRCRSDGNGAFTVEAGPERVVSVGALRFGLDDLRSRLAACDDGVRVAVFDDALLGQRLRIEAADPAAASAALLAAGHSRLVVDAVLGNTGGRTSSG